MPVDVQPYRTRRFTDWSPLAALGALGILAIAVVVSPFLSRRLLNTTVQVSPEETTRLEAVQPRGGLGALRIDTRARLPKNTWLTFEVQVFDSQNNLLASGIKQAWRESGIWREDGESGTWSEQDLKGRFDIRRASIDQPITLAITVLEQGRTGGQPLAQPVSFEVTVRDGVIDSRFLWVGFFGVLVIALITSLAVGKSGRKVVSERANDSDVAGRATLGGADKLVRVNIDVISDETSPRELQAHLIIKDGYGEQIYSRRLSVPLTFRREDGKIDSAKGHVSLDLVLEPRGSYGFSVEVMPDGPVDYTYLAVKEGVRTLQPTEIIRLRT
ncbi:hypothetical protein XM38_049200 [Halomicronema hongdechloris C2206]|uniref:Uncharacterized protein n=1 Tax=Halomicronema hongdechloris C2206 TaxID=1641165 RepID=A0A1Z3HUJ2_9CYAN|nr:hypothetical protein [Halomicronema hongdechloris]ASC73946.1 hypothetical protein XM38_049200 [Halomicronema hongdechloris C2206]